MRRVPNRKEQDELIAEMWNNNFSCSEIADALKTCFNYYIEPPSIKNRAQELSKIGVVNRRKPGWNMKCKPGMARYMKLRYGK